MSQENINRITISQDICHGKPTIRGTRIMVETLLEHLAAGDSIEDVLVAFPDLEREDLLAALAYASRAVQMKGTVLKAA